MVFAMQVREWVHEYALDSNEVSQVVGRDFILQSEEMSLSASSLLRNGCTELLLGVGSKGSRKGGNRVVRTGCRCEVKNEVKVDAKVCVGEKICAVSGKRCGATEEEAARCAFNGAMLMCNVAHNIDERARNDFLLLSRWVHKFLMEWQQLWNRSGLLE